MTAVNQVSLGAGALVATTRARFSKGPLRPTWTFTMELIARFLKATAARIRPMPWVEKRAAWDSLARPTPAWKRTTFEAVTLGGVPARRVVPESREGGGVLLYLHGGAYCYGSTTSHHGQAAQLALASEGEVYLLDYRLAPEHPFPAALDDATAAFTELAARVGPKRVAVGGDSAGGGLSLALMLRLRDEGAPLPACGALLCPWVDHTARGGSLVDNCRFDWAEPEEIPDWTKAYAGAADPAGPLISPGLARLEGLPPLLVHVGTAEALLDQVRAFCARAKAAGVAVELHEAVDMIHNWHTLVGMIPEAGRDLAAVGAFLRHHTGGR